MSSPFLTISGVADIVSEIQAMSDDDEKAHSVQDALIQRVLREIAAGHPYPMSLAATVAQVYDLDFSRWTA